MYPLASFCILLTAQPSRLVSPWLCICLYSNRILWPRPVASSPPSPIGWSRRGCAFACRSRRGFKSYPLASFCILFHRRAWSVGLTALAHLLGDPAGGFKSYPLASFCVFFTAEPSRLVSPRSAQSAQERPEARRSAQEHPRTPRSAQSTQASERAERAQRASAPRAPKNMNYNVGPR